MGGVDIVVVSDYELAKEANSREDFADRPQWDKFIFYMKHKNAGEFN
jgi:hypothetical protein